MIISFWIYSNENKTGLNLVIEDVLTKDLIGSINYMNSIMIVLHQN
ncbi:MAG: hypothetical protein WC008_01290 [Bacilli bacterium]